MKIEFDPLDQDHREELRHILNANAYISALDEIYNKARGILKHGDPEDKEAIVEALEEIKVIAATHLFEE